MDEETLKVYLEEFRLGEDARAFLNEPLGRYLLGRAHIEMELAKESLLRLNPHSWFARRRMAKAQMQYGVAHQFVRWLNDAIVNGDIALSQIEGSDDNMD